MFGHSAAFWVVRDKWNRAAISVVWQQYQLWVSAICWVNQLERVWKWLPTFWVVRDKWNRAAISVVWQHYQLWVSAICWANWLECVWKWLPTPHVQFLLFWVRVWIVVRQLNVVGIKSMVWLWSSLFGYPMFYLFSSVGLCFSWTF